MRAIFVLVALSCLAPVQASAQTVPLVVQTSNPDGAAVAGVNTAAEPTDRSVGVYGQGFTGVIGRGATWGGMFTSELGRGVAASGYQGGVMASCVSDTCSALYGAASPGGGGTGVLGRGYWGVVGVAVPGPIPNIGPFAGLFYGNVRVTQDLTVLGQFVSPGMTALRAELLELRNTVESLSTVYSLPRTLLPARIEAESYDPVAGMGYYDSTPGNEGGAYRNDDVDIKMANGGYVVGWMTAGEWLAYTAVTRTTGRYSVRVCVGSALPGRTFSVSIGSNGYEITGIPVPTFDNWDEHGIVTLPPVDINAGSTGIVFRVGPEDYLDFDWIEIMPLGNDAQKSPELWPGQVR